MASDLGLDTNLKWTPSERGRSETRLQPWKAFWPFTGDVNSDTWVSSEFPEVASWKFDPKRPFDRPWRMWTRTTLAKTEKCPIQLETQQVDHVDYYNEKQLENLFVQLLDTLILRRRMTKVTRISLGYLAPLALYQREKPYLSRLPALPGFARTNIVARNQPIQIHDVSGNEDLFALDSSGFQFSHFPEPLGEWTDSSLCATYIPKLRHWLKAHLDCTDVYIYAYSFRGNAQGMNREKTWKAPFFRTHCDATAASCDRRLQLYLPDELKELAHGKRIRFLNVWRPLTTPVQDSPLALCDYRTVSPNDLVAADMVFPHYLDEAYEVLYNPNHRWFFKQGMEDGNVILLKLADSADEVAKLCPHAAFLDPSVPDGTPERASVELRAIIIG